MELGKSLCILISGKSGTGKDCVAILLAKALENIGLKTVLRYKFATDVKYVAGCMGWNGIKDEKGRKLLQDIGKIGRLYDIDLWAKSLFNAVNEDWPNYPLDAIIVSDWRFPNELEYCKQQSEYNVITIRIEAPKREALWGTHAYYDVSETSLPNGISEMYDYVIYNEMNLEELKKYVEELANSIIKKQVIWSE